MTSFIPEKEFGLRRSIRRSTGAPSLVRRPRVGALTGKKLASRHWVQPWDATHLKATDS